MSDGIASPFSTGAGGSNFEAKVQAAFLTALICGVPLPCLPPAQITGVRFQGRQAGFRTDDIIATAEGVGGRQHKLLCQIKHQLAFTKSDDGFRDAIINAWHDFDAAGLIDRTSDAIALITGPISAKAINEVRPVLEWARHCSSGEEFVAKVQTAHFSSNGKRGFVTGTREIIETSIKRRLNDDEIWTFLKLLHLLSYDFDVAYSQDEARTIRLVEMVKVPSHASTAGGLWAQLIDFVRGYNQNAGSIEKRNLADTLPTGLRDALLSSPRVYDSPSVRRLAEHTELTLRLVSDEFVSGVSIRREALLERAIEALNASQVILLTSEAGGGKSALAKQMLDRLAPEGPRFVFRVEEFDHPHLHQALTAIGIADSISDLSVRFGLLPQRLLLVEGVERLLEMDHKQAFHQLLEAVAGDGQWLVILTCRTHAANWLATHFLAGGALQPLAVPVPRLSADEVAQVAAQVPSIQPYLGNGAVADVLRTPFYLRIACHSAPGTISLPSTPDAIRRTLWQAAVQNPARSQAGLPFRRERAFIKLAVRRAKLMQPYVTAEAGDDEAMTALIADGVVEQADGGRLAPAHDLFEDWAVEAHVEKCFEEAEGEPSRLFELVGPEPALRRAFRHWLGVALNGPAAPRVADLAIAACRNSAIPQHWRDEVLVSVLLSPDADSLLRRLESGLLVDEKALLVRTVHLLRTACKGPNHSLLQQMGISQHSRDQLGLYFTRPIGSGWEAIIGLIFRHLDDFGLKDAGLIEGLLTDWSAAIDVNHPPQAPSQMSADVALRYLALLSESQGWHRDLDEKFIDILMKIPGARPDEVTALFTNAIRDTNENPMYRTLLQKGASSLTCYSLCRHLPDVAIAVAESFARPRRRRRHGRLGYEDEDFTIGLEAPFGLGRTFGLKMHPPSALTGPFIHLLSHHPKKALPFIVRLTNNAVDAYNRSRFGNECNTTMLKMPGQAPRPIITSDRLWCLYRGTTVGPQFLEACLMALESKLLQRAEAGEDLSGDARFILETTNSVALVAVLASVGIAHAEALGEMVLPLVSSIRFLKLDKIRMVRDFSHGTDLRGMLGIPKGGLDDIYYGERKKADAAPHRKEELETLLAKLQFTSFREKIHNSIDAMRAEVADEGDAEENILNQLLFKRIDVREWEIVEHAEYGHVITPRIDEPDLRVAVQEASDNQKELNRWLILHNWAIAVFTRKGDGQNAFPNWREALGSAITLYSETGEPDPENFVERLGVFAAVASVAVRDYGAELDHDQLEWCTARIEEEIRNDADNADPMASHQRHGSHGSRPAAAVAPLLLGLSKDNAAALQRVRQMIAVALTHAVDEVVTYAAFGARSELWRLDPDFAQCCFSALVWQAQAQGTVALRPFGPLEDYYSQRLRDAHEARTRMLADGLPEMPTTIELSTVATRDLLHALWTVPFAAREGSYVTILAQVLAQLADAVAQERDARGHRERIIQDFEFRQAFSALYAETLLTCRPDGVQLLVDTILATIDSAPEVAGQVLEEVLLAADQRQAYDRFWMIWRPAAEKILGHGAGRRRGRGRHGDLVEIILFARAPWKSGVKCWEPLEANRSFILDAFPQVGHTGSGFGALVKLLQTVGGFMLPEAIIELNDARKRAMYDVLEERDLRLELELVLRDAVLVHGSTVRYRETLRQACLELLDELVNRGSSLAFQLREILISPSRRRSADDESGAHPQVRH